ncbi:MAG: acyltransferase [Chromatiales bacterium]|nr:acyltransferase [Chromatiales bacterium]
MFRHPYTTADRGIVLGSDCILFEHVRVLIGDLRHCADADIQIGDHVFVNAGSYLSGEGGLVIGDHAIIGAHCRLLSAGHDPYGPNEAVNQNALTFGRISIGRGAWLGAGVTVLQGRKIGTGAVVGAGSVVTRDIPDRAIAVGNPARVVGSR